jgi:hypothetical protein
MDKDKKNIIILTLEDANILINHKINKNFIADDL